MQLTNNNLLDLKSRKEIYKLITTHPGIHLRRIIKEIHLSEGTVRYHINYLTKHGLIIKLKKNGYLRFYLSDENNVKNKKVITYLQNENTIAIILFFCVFVCGSLKTICRVLNKDKKDISIYLNKLLENELIEIAPGNKKEFLTGFTRCKLIEYDKTKKSVKNIM